MKKDRALAYVAFAIVCVVWGTTYLGIRVAIETIPPLSLTAIRFIIAGAVMLAIARLRGEVIPTNRRVIGSLVIVGFLMVGVGNLAVVWAEQWVPSGLAALFVAGAPFWMAVLEAFRKQGERLDYRGVIGMLLGFVGVALLVTPGGAGKSWELGFIVGAIAIQVGSIGWQYGSVIGKYNLKDVPLLASAALQMLFGGLIVGVVALAIGEPSRFAMNTRTFAALAYLTLFGSILAYSAYVYALAHLPTTKVSMYAYINPVVAVFLGWLILNEEMTWISLLAMCVILAGVAMVQMSKRPKLQTSSVVEAQKSAA